MYDSASWNLIIAGLKSKDHDNIHVLNRAQILDDVFNFGRSGLMDYERVFEIASYLTEEEHYLPWLSAFTNFAIIERRMDADNLVIFKVFTWLLVQVWIKFITFFACFQKYVLNLIEKIYKKLSFSFMDSDSQLDIYNRAQVLSWACKYGSADCIADSTIRFLPLLEKDAP